MLVACGRWRSGSGACQWPGGFSGLRDLAWANAWEVLGNIGEWDWKSGTANDTNLHVSAMSLAGLANLVGTQHISSTSIRMDYSGSNLVFIPLSTIRVNSRGSRFIHS
jgi:hypothetical protein